MKKKEYIKVPNLKGEVQMKKIFLKKLLVSLMTIGIYAMPVYAQIYVNDIEKATYSEVNGNEVQYIKATTASDVLTVNGNIDTDTEDIIIEAMNGSGVTVNGNIFNYNDEGSSETIKATDGAVVNITGNVANSGSGSIINIIGDGSSVTVNGNVISESNTNYVINAVGTNAIIKVGGNVCGLSKGLNVSESNVATIEGMVQGEINAQGQVYIGKLDGEISNGQDNVHYLIGFDNNTLAASAILTDKTTLFSPLKTINGVDGKEYYYTETADPKALIGKTISFYSYVNEKKLLIDNIPEGVTLSEIDDVTTLTLTENFKGGLQNIKLSLKENKISNIEISIDDFIGKPKEEFLNSIKFDSSLGTVIYKELYDENVETDFDSLEEGTEYQLIFQLHAPEKYYYDNEQIFEPIGFYTYQPKVSVKINNNTVDGLRISGENAEYTETDDPTTGVKLEIIYYFTPRYTYLPLDNTDNQEFTVKNIKEFIIKIDGDYTLFESLKIGSLDLVKNVDYTVTEGSTVLTFTSSGITKLNTLAVGNYNIEVNYANSQKATGTLTIKEDTTEIPPEPNTPSENPAPSAPPAENTPEVNKTNIPKTGDNIMYVISGLATSVAGLFITKRKF